jgi:hypothetical protein
MRRLMRQMETLTFGERIQFKPGTKSGRAGSLLA